MGQVSPPSDHSAALPAGMRLGEFEILDVVGVGGFSIVYRALDHSLQREVALKEYMPAGLATRQVPSQVVASSGRTQETFHTGLKSFVNEAKLLAQFDHPSLVKVHRFWEANGTAYMVMPLYRGTTLKDKVRQLGRAPDESWLMDMVAPLTEALAVIHAENCFHRDIAPDNIMLLAGSERPLLLDFGAARRVIGDMTQALTVMLKPGYAPIEQYADMPGLRSGPWTDVYALAAVMHWAITGRTPPPSVARLVNDTYEPLVRAAAGRFGESFLSALDHALAVRPEHRTASIGQFRAELGLDQIRAIPGLPAPSELDDEAARPAVRQSLPTTPVVEPPAQDPGHTVIVAKPPNPAPRDPSRAVPPDATLMFGAGTKTSTSSILPAVALAVTAAEQAAFIGRKLLLGDGELLIGRENSPFNIPDPTWSRRHAAVRRSDAGVTITDLGSSNGTFVNGRAIPPGQACVLHLGAGIRIGSTSFALVLADDGMPPDLSGTEVDGSYALMECLHASPKGTVYRARKKGSGVEVALKILSPAYAAFGTYRERFAREAAIATRLMHPHICRLDHFGETVLGSGQRVPYLSYQILAGGNLADRMPSAGTLPTETIAGWIRDLASALGHAHGQGVVHGNMKPSAVCFDAASHIYLTDFAIGTDDGASLFGSPAFMAPEQWTGAARPESDQYALAVLAYLLLAGVRPFEGQDDPDTRERNLRRGPPPLHQEAARAGRQLSVAATKVLERALGADPASRFADVQAFATDLARALQPGAGVQGATPVFISYRRGGGAGWVAYITEHLEREYGITSFVDIQRLDGAGKFSQRIERAIEACDVFVCLLDVDTLSSAYVRQEIALAHRLGKRMIPIFQEGFDARDEYLADVAIAELLQYDGVKLLDRQNVYVRAAVAELAQQIRTTLGRLS